MKKISELKEKSSLSLVEKYILGLKEAYQDNNADDEWDEFEEFVQGATQEDICKLKEAYPQVPNSLIELLEYVDGTYFRIYNDQEIAFYFLGSDLEEYPYYLLSINQMLENQQKTLDIFSDYINRQYTPEEVSIDKRIIDNDNQMKWLHFSDCMNNGGSSKLFIDFSPSEFGKVGQVVMYVHDPDSIEVIADSFDEYLENMIENEYDFINEDVVG